MMILDSGVPFWATLYTVRTMAPTRHLRPPDFCRSRCDRMEQCSRPCPHLQRHWSCFCVRSVKKFFCVFCSVLTHWV